MKDPDVVVVAVSADQGRAQLDEIKTKKGEVDSPASYETAVTACGFGKFHYILMLGLVPLCAAQLFSSGALSYVMPTAACDLKLNDFEKGTLNAATYLGNIASGLIWGGLSDMYGRRKIVICCFLADFVVCLACSFAHTYALLLVLKILAGAIIAGPNSVMMAYLAETHDDRHRGFAIMANGMAFGMAQVLQPILAYLLLPLSLRVPLVEGVLELTAWRVFLLVCAAPSLVSGLFFLRLPESPKFLMSRGRAEEALAVFRWMYVLNTGNSPDSYPVKSLDVDAVARTADGADDGGLKRAWRQFRPLFSRRYASRMLVIIGAMVNVMLCINSLRLWMPQLFALMDQYEHEGGREPASTACQMITAVLKHPVATNASAASEAVAVAVPSLAALRDVAGVAAPRVCAPVSAEVYLRSVIIGTTGTLSLVASGWIIGKVGNRPLMLGSFPMALVVGLAMLWASDADVFMALVAVHTPLTSIGLNSMTAITVDLFPTALRGLTVSLAMISGRIASLTGNLILPVLLNISCEAVFVFISVCMFLCSIFVWFLPTKLSQDEKN